MTSFTNLVTAFVNNTLAGGVAFVLVGALYGVAAFGSRVSYTLSTYASFGRGRTLLGVAACPDNTFAVFAYVTGSSTLFSGTACVYSSISSTLAGGKVAFEQLGAPYGGAAFSSRVSYTLSHHASVDNCRTLLGGTACFDSRVSDTLAVYAFFTDRNTSLLLSVSACLDSRVFFTLAAYAFEFGRTLSGSAALRFFYTLSILA